MGYRKKKLKDGKEFKVLVLFLRQNATKVFIKKDS